MPTSKKTRKSSRASDSKTSAQKVNRDNEQSKTSSLTISYLVLRKTVGLLGTALSVIVFLGGLIIFQTELQGSISSYYYTGMRDALVGVLCAMGIFLYSYKGYERKDDLAGNFASIFAIGVALFPTTPEGVTVSNSARIIGYLHLGFAAAFFGTLSYFSLVLFTKTHQNSATSITVRKQQRNGGYMWIYHGGLHRTDGDSLLYAEAERGIPQFSTSYLLAGGFGNLCVRDFLVGKR